MSGRRGILERLDNLAAELQLIRQSVSDFEQEEPERDPPLETLRVRVERSHQERRPYRFVASGSLTFQHDLSPIRASVFLIMLLDLQRRSEGFDSFSDPRRLIGEAYSVFEPRDSKDLANTIRISLYRFAEYSETDLDLVGSDMALHFISEECRLACKPAWLLDGRLKVDIETEVPEILQIINKTVGASLLVRLDREKALYVPGGPDGIDQLVLEFFDHDREVLMEGLYFRPTLHNFPIDLLEKMGVSEQRLKRARIVRDGLNNGRVGLVDVMAPSGLKQLVDLEDAGFRMYPANITRDDVKHHLQHFQKTLEMCTNFQFLLSDAPMPFFHLALFTLGSGPKSSHYSIVMRRERQEYAYDDACLAVAGRPVHQSLRKGILEPLLSSPLTAQSNATTIETLGQMIEGLA